MMEGSPSYANPAKLVRRRLAEVTTAPDGIESRSNFSSPSAGPVPQRSTTWRRHRRRTTGPLPKLVSGEPALT